MGSCPPLQIHDDENLTGFVSKVLGMDLLDDERNEICSKIQLFNESLRMPDEVKESRKKELVGYIDRVISDVQYRIDAANIRLQVAKICPPKVYADDDMVPHTLRGFPFEHLTSAERDELCDELDKNKEQPQIQRIANKVGIRIWEMYRNLIRLCRTSGNVLSSVHGVQSLGRLHALESLAERADSLNEDEKERLCLLAIT